MSAKCDRTLKINTLCVDFIFMPTFFMNYNQKQHKNAKKKKT